jgi:glyoxylase-like metal-dependent hydrolase (beta-lactamase superfamily II)
MTLLLDTPPGEDGLVVLRCGLWGYNAIGVVSGNEACAVDPGITPDEIATLRAALEDGGRRVTHVLLTHSHHDHIRGWSAFPGATVVAPRVVAEKGETPRARILAGKARVDEKLGVDDPDFRYPEVDVAFDRDHTVRVGDLDVRMEFLPGHSNCTSVVHVPALRALLTADYLVSPGLPYCRWEAGPFVAANERLRALVTGEGVELVVPAHNDLLHGRDAALAAIDEELEYFRQLREVVREQSASGASVERIVRNAAAAVGDRRTVAVGAKAIQDLDNARRVLAELQAS